MESVYFSLVTLVKDKILSDNYFTLHNITYDLTRAKMAKLSAINVKFTIAVMVRRSSCTTRKKKTVVLIRQFRVATWVNGNESGQLIETCAEWLLDNDEPGSVHSQRSD